MHPRARAGDRPGSHPHGVWESPRGAKLVGEMLGLLVDLMPVAFAMLLVWAALSAAVMVGLVLGGKAQSGRRARRPRTR